MIGMEKDRVSLTNIRTVEDFADIFLEDLPGLPLICKIEFSFKLLPNTVPLSKAPYRMALRELHKLKIQIHELMDKVIIYLSVSPWGALVLFVKKKDHTLRMCTEHRELKELQ